MAFKYSNINSGVGENGIWSRSLRPLHLKQLVFQALMKRIPHQMLGSFF